MADPYLGEIRLFAGNYAPDTWLFCDGTVLPIAQFNNLFDLIGTTYGGDGENTFNLPDLRGRVPIHQGTGQSGSTYQIGELGGVEQVTLTAQQLPAHGHPFVASTAGGNATNPQGRVIASPPGISPYLPDVPSTNLAPNTVGPVGGSQPHENRTSFIVINYIICVEGGTLPR
jgi:microcystin-dependent protein